MKEVIIREARREDASRLLEIYAYYIENTAITFEYTVPSLKEFQIGFSIFKPSTLIL